MSLDNKISFKNFYLEPYKFLNKFFLEAIFTNKVVINKESTNMTKGLSPVTSINSSSSVCNPRSVNNDTNG